MSKITKEDHTDIEVCMQKIKEILREYSCNIQTDDYHHAWLYDNDTGLTVGGFND